MLTAFAEPTQSKADIRKQAKSIGSGNDQFAIRIHETPDSFQRASWRAQMLNEIAEQNNVETTVQRQLIKVFDITNDQSAFSKFRLNGLHGTFVAIEAYDFRGHPGQMGMKNLSIAESLQLFLQGAVGLAHETKMQDGAPFAAVEDEPPTRAIAA